MKTLVRRRLLSILLVAFLLIGAFFAGSLLQKYLQNPNTLAIKFSHIIPPQPTPTPIQLKDEKVKQQAQSGLLQFLTYLKTTGTPDMKLTDYKIQTLESIYMKEQEVHAIFAIDLFPANTLSSQSLVTKGGILQKNGWVTGTKAYIRLAKQGNQYIIHEISFFLPDNF